MRRFPGLGAIAVFLIAPLAAGLSLFVAGCNSANSGADSTAIDSILADTTTVLSPKDSLARIDSIEAVGLRADSVRLAKAIDNGSIKEMLEIYSEATAALMAEYGADGYPLGEEPAELTAAKQLKQKLTDIESRMSQAQKDSFELFTGRIRGLL